MIFVSNEFLFNSFYSHIKVSPIKSVGETRRDDDTSKLFEKIGTGWKVYCLRPGQLSYCLRSGWFSYCYCESFAIVTILNNRYNS